MSIVKLLRKRVDRILFTTPSHNQKSLFSKEYSNFYKDDVSEFDGYDNLSNPSGEILTAQARASYIYDTLQTFFITQGATCAILSAMKSIIKPNDKVLVARNCHKSVYSGLVLTYAKVDWFLPDVDEDWGIYTRIDTKKLESTLELNDYKCFILTSPTYEGINSDIFEIAKICKKHDTYLIVDESHGSLYNFSSSFPKTAIKQGADIAINSLHKTAGALNQTALLHISKDMRNVDIRKFQDTINLFHTTSPSYPLLKNIEECIEFLNSNKGKKKIEKLLKAIIKIKSELSKFDVEFFDEKYHDPTKILLRKKGISGKNLSEYLFDKYKVEDELNNDVFCLFLTGIGTTEKKLNKLKYALTKIPQDSDYVFKPVTLQPFPLTKLQPWEAIDRNSAIVEKQNSLLNLSSRMILPYPPGIGILYPGEAIQEWHFQYLNDNVEVIIC